MANTIQQIISFVTSRTIRQATATDGIRTIDVNPISASGSRNAWWDVASNIASALGTVIASAFNWTLTGLWSVLVNATNFIFNFNFNQTDTFTNQQLTTAFNRCASLLGMATGDLLGKLACGALPTVIIMQINPTMGDAIASGITEELLTKASSVLYNCANGCLQTLINAGALWMYGNLRRAFIGSDDQFKQKLQKAGLNPTQIQQAIQQRDQPFILRQEVQNQINQIPNNWWKIFTEQAFQQFGLSCTEAGYVVCQHIEQYWRDQELAGGANMKTVEVSFDANNNPTVTTIILPAVTSTPSPSPSPTPSPTPNPTITISSSS